MERHGGWVAHRVVMVAAAMSFGVCVGCTTVPKDAPVRRVTLPNAERVFTPQRRGDWCWAACAEMALKYNGIDDITQEDLVARLKKDADDQRAQELEIIVALATEPQQRGASSSGGGGMPRGVHVDSQRLVEAVSSGLGIYTSSDSAAADLARGDPVLLGLRDYKGAPGHIVFVTAMEVQERKVVGSDTPVVGPAWAGLNQAFKPFVGSFDYSIVSIDCYDPMPETGGVTTLTAAEVDAHVRFYMSRRRAKEVMSDLSNVVRLTN